jgi:hypothetical protein
MVRSIIEFLLGEVGRQILYFYEANACLINSFVLTYGVIMFAAWTNLVRIYRFMIITIAKNVHVSEDLNRKSTRKKIRDTAKIPWEDAVEASPMPIVGRMSGLIPKRKTVENLQVLIDEDELIDGALRVLKGEDVRRMAPSSKRMREREIKEIREKLDSE